jgi:membrane-associated PAP2 superfamily phosphatase
VSQQVDVWEGPASPARPWGATLLALAFVAAWDASGADLLLAHAMGGQEHFPLRDAWLLAYALHRACAWVSWTFLLFLYVGIFYPTGPLRPLELRARIQLVATPLAAAFVIWLLKHFSATSCPWDLGLYGGTAPYAWHWTARVDGGPGHCFPAGHAAYGFAFIGGYFAFRNQRPRLASTWLASSLAVGFAIGIIQQLRGAHFMSHTLWTGLLCWMVALMADHAMDFVMPPRRPRAPRPWPRT